MDKQNEKDCLKADTIDIIKSQSFEIAEKEGPTKLDILRGLS